MCRFGHLKLGVAIAIALVSLSLIACASSPSPDLTGNWIGEFTEAQDPAPATQVAMQLRQDGEGRLSGQAKMCGGQLGDKQTTFNATGVITPAKMVRIELTSSGIGQGFRFEGAYSASRMTLPGTFGGNYGTPIHHLSLSLAPAGGKDPATICP
jgi:hypothetical protein